MATTFTDVYPNAAPTIAPEAGKVYRTRNGRKVGPLSLYGGKMYAEYKWQDMANPIEHYANTWMADGRFHEEADVMTEYDIVAEWVETDTRPTIAPAAGKRYLMRNGEGVGPMRFRGNDEDQPWIGFVDTGLARLYTDDGRHYSNPDHDLVAEVTDTPTAEGPVRRRTVTEIAPGTYGIVQVFERLGIGQNPYVYVENRSYSAEDLRSAAAVMTTLADALDEMGGAS